MLMPLHESPSRCSASKAEKVRLASPESQSRSPLEDVQAITGLDMAAPHLRQLPRTSASAMESISSNRLNLQDWTAHS